MDTKLSYYILNGKRVEKTNLREWGKFFETRERIIKQETLPNGYWISTVFLGLDHNFSGGRPLLFETMAFKPRFATAKIGDKDYNLREEVAMDRYFTYKQAEEGHQKMVDEWIKKPKLRRK